MTTKEMLEKAGWRRISYRKQGMIRIAFWCHLKTGNVFRQGEAVQIERDRRRYAASIENQLAEDAS